MREEVGGPQARRPLPRPPPPAGRGAAGRPGRLAGRRLPGLARGPADRRLLDGRPAQRRGRSRASASKTSKRSSTNRSTATIVWRTVRIAALVTVTDAILAFPIAFYMAKVASRRGKAILVVAVLLPLWSSYLVKVYAWRTMLSDGGVINWALEPFGLHGPGLRHHRGLAGDELPLAAVHDPADLRRAGADPRTR